MEPVGDTLCHIMRKPAFCICGNKGTDQLHNESTLKGFVFAIYIAQSLFFLNPKLQASSILLQLYTLICVGNPEDRVSCNAAHFSAEEIRCVFDDI